MIPRLISITPVLRAALAGASLLSAPFAFAADAAANKNCPLMTDDEAEADRIVDFKGVPVALCCGRCEEGWKANDKATAYYVKVATELGLLPQFKGKEKELGLEEIKLIPQRFCPIRDTSLITPYSPSVDYQGEKVYFFNEKAKAKWEKDPEAAAKKAIEAGLLPQLKKTA